MRLCDPKRDAFYTPVGTIAIASRHLGLDFRHVFIKGF